jgi:DNA-binding GntR family transcriptional regulator
VPSPQIPALPSPMPPGRTYRGDATAARASMAAANSLAAGLSAREASHIAFFDLLAAGDAEAALAALPAHLDAWPREF